MTKLVSFEGRTIAVPDDATEDEIRQILEGSPAVPGAQGVDLPQVTGGDPGTGLRGGTPVDPLAGTNQLVYDPGLDSFGQPIELSHPGALEDSLVQSGYSAAHWPTDLLGAPVDLALFGSRVGDWITDQLGLTPEGGTGSFWEYEQKRRAEEGTPPPFGTDWIYGHTIGQLIGEAPEPTTPEGKFFGSVTRGANPLPFVAKPATIFPGMVAGGVGGGAYEALDAMGAPPEISGLVAFLTGATVDASLGLGGRSNLLTPTAGRVIRDTVGDLPESELARAYAMEQAGHDIGVPLTWAESIGTTGPTGLASDIWGSRQGGYLLDQYMNQRAEQVLGAFEDASGQFGPTPTPRDAAAGAQEAAEGTIKTLNERRTDASIPHYGLADVAHVDPGGVRTILDALDDIEAPRGSKLGLEVARMRRMLTTGRTDPLTGLPEVQTLIAPLHQAYKELRESLNANVVNVDAMARSVRGQIGRVNGMLHDLLMENPDFQTAEQLYAANSPGVTRMEQSPVGTMATADKAVGQPNAGTMISAITDPKTIRPADIAYTAAALRATDPNAFTRLVQVYLENAMGDAQGRGGLGVPDSPRAGAFFQDTLGKPGTPEAANLDQMLREMAVSSGLDPDNVVAGWRRMLDVFDRTGRIPGQGSRTEFRQDLRDAAGNNIVSATANAASLKPLSGFADWVRRRNMAGAYRDIARTLVDPNSLRAMEELARTGTISPRTLWALQQVVTQNAFAEANDDWTPPDPQADLINMIMGGQ
jgi:hypothetical protein